MWATRVHDFARMAGHGVAFDESSGTHGDRVTTHLWGGRSFLRSGAALSSPLIPVPHACAVVLSVSFLFYIIYGILYYALWSTVRTVADQKLQIPHGSVPRAFFGGRHWMGAYTVRFGWKGDGGFCTAPSMNTGAGCLCAKLSQRCATRCREGSCIAA